MKVWLIVDSLKKKLTWIPLIHANILKTTSPSNKSEALKFIADKYILHI